MTSSGAGGDRSSIRYPYLAHEHPIRLAHRGSWVLWPENTLEAFQGVAAMGYRYVETDLRITRDGVVVVFHDAALERLTNGRGRVDQWAWDDLRHLDAGWRFAPDQGFPLRGRGIGIPRLDEVLAAFPALCFNLDLKQAGLEWPVAEVLVTAHRQDSVLVGSFSDRRLARFRRITRNEVAISAGPRAAVRLWAASRMGRTIPQAGFAAYQVPFDRTDLRLDRRFVAAAHAAGAQVHAWTVNRAADMANLLDLGVDGIVTDRPDVLDEVLAARSRP